MTNPLRMRRELITAWVEQKLIPFSDRKVPIGEEIQEI